MTDRRNATLLRKYGLTAQQYDKLLTLQGGVCALCGKPPKAGGRKLAVDHDHKTKRVRGLLCVLPCNRYYVAKNTLETARKVVKYLNRRFDGRDL